jgi:hypothetical protein
MSLEKILWSFTLQFPRSPSVLWPATVLSSSCIPLHLRDRFRVPVSVLEAVQELTQMVDGRKTVAVGSPRLAFGPGSDHGAIFTILIAIRRAVKWIWRCLDACSYSSVLASLRQLSFTLVRVHLLLIHRGGST